MSRIGKKPIQIPDGVKVILKPGCADISGPLGKFSQPFHPTIIVQVDEAKKLIIASRPENDNTNQSKALHGLVRALLANAVQGVTQGFEKRLHIEGTGYNAKLKGKHIEISVGNVMPTSLEIPDGLKVEVPQPTKVVVKGLNRQLVGQFAASIRAIRKPEPYKGKGIRYENEVIRRKAGKSFGSGT